MSLSLLLWNTANTLFMTVCIQSPPRLTMVQVQKSSKCLWLTCSGWCWECVSFVFSYKGSHFTWQGQWHAKVNVLRLTVGYLNPIVKRKTWNTEPGIGIDWHCQTRQNPRVDGCRSGYGPLRRCSPGFWMVLERNPSGFPVRTRTHC